MYCVCIYFVSLNIILTIIGLMFLRLIKLDQALSDSANEEISLKCYYKFCIYSDYIA